MVKKKCETNCKTFLYKKNRQSELDVLWNQKTKKNQNAKKKLDRVALVDNRPSADSLQHFVPPPQKKITYDMQHVTCDTWHVTL